MIVKCKYVLFICVDDFTIRESILWLRNNLSPWELVKNHWKVTEAYRRNQIQTSQNKNSGNFLSVVSIKTTCSTCFDR